MPALMQDFQVAVPQSEAVQVEWEVLGAHGVMLSMMVPTQERWSQLSALSHRWPGVGKTQWSR